MKQHVNHNQLKGFTLIELVVASAVFAVLAVISYSGISAVLDNRQAIDEKRQQVIALQRVYALLKNDLRYATARPVRDELGDFESAMIIDQNGELLRITTQYPTIGANKLKRVSWELKDNALWRNHFDVLDRVEGSEKYQRKLLDNLSQVNVYIHSLNEQDRVTRSAIWEEQTFLPLALEIEIEMQNQHTYKWIFELSGK